MSIQFFAPRDPHNEIIKLPTISRRTVRWLPQIGEVFPDFSVDTTQGQIRFWDWAPGKWTHLFSHPAAFTPVCTTEIASIAMLRTEWSEHRIQHLALTGSSVEEQILWHEHIEELFDVHIALPTAHDPFLTLSKLFGMVHEKESRSWPVRKSFVLDPDMRIRMISEYPVYIGRNISEILRVIRAMQLRDRTGAATPADWDDGDVALIPDNRPEDEVIQHFGTASRRLMSYLRVVDPQDA